MLLVVMSEVVGGAETEGRDPADAERGRQQGERGNGDDEGRGKKPTQEHLLFSPVWEGWRVEGKKEKSGWWVLSFRPPDLALV